MSKSNLLTNLNTGKERNLKGNLLNQKYHYSYPNELDIGKIIEDFDEEKIVCCFGAGYVGGPTMSIMANNCPDYLVNNF